MGGMFNIGGGWVLYIISMTGLSGLGTLRSVVWGFTASHSNVYIYIYICIAVAYICTYTYIRMQIVRIPIQSRVSVESSLARLADFLRMLGWLRVWTRV